MADDEVEDDKPLDPAIEAVRKRLARLMVVSISIMMVGILAVLGAVVYKTSTPSSNAVTTQGLIAIPNGMTIIDQSLDGDRIALRLRSGDGSETLMVYSLIDGSVAGTWAIAQAMKE